MGTYYITTHGSSVLLDANEGNPSAVNGSFTEWSPGDKFILAVIVFYNTLCNKATDGCQLKLQFAEDGGEFGDVGAGTAIAWCADADTSLTDDAEGTQRVGSGTPAAQCDSGYGTAWENAEDNTLPDSGADMIIAQEQWLETHWALNPANANPESVYTFQVANITNSGTALTNAIASSVTMAVQYVPQIMVTLL